MTILLAAVMVGSLLIYVLLAGSDYGAGFWDLLSRGASKEQQRELIANAIRPIWEANHVWLILIFVLLFSAFPRAFGAIMIALYVPIVLMLLGIVLRGSSFVFRAYSPADSTLQRTCGYVFSASSSFTPIFAGITLASLSDDRVLVQADTSTIGYLASWLNPFSVTAGFFTLALFAYLAAAFLSVEAQDTGLRQLFRHRAFIAGVVSALFGYWVVSLSARYAPGFNMELTHRAVVRGAEITALLSLLIGLLAIHKDRMRAARWTVGVYATSIVAAWAGAQYPYLARPDSTIFNSAVSEAVVRDIFYASLAGAILLFPSLSLLLYIFKDQKRQRTLSAMQKAQS